MPKVSNLLLEILKTFPLYFFILLALVFIQSSLNTLTVITIAPLVDFLMQHSIEESSKITIFLNKVYFLILGKNEIPLGHLLIFISSTTIFTCFAGIGIKYVAVCIKYKVNSYLIKDALTEFYQARFSFFSQANLGVLINSFQNEVKKISDAYRAITTLFGNFFQVVILLVIPFTFSPKLTIFFIITAIILTGPLWLLKKLFYNLGKKNTETANIMTGVLHEILLFAKLIHSFGKQKESIERYEKSFLNHVKVSIKSQTLFSGLYMLFIPLGQVAALITLYRAFFIGMPFGEIALIFFAFARLLPLWGQILADKTIIEMFLPAHNQIQKLKKEAHKLKEPRGDTQFVDLRDGIYFKKINFNYPERNVTLKNLSLKITKGKITALVGKSGAGKTTIVDLILGLYKHNNGEILIDDIEIEKINLRSYRNSIGYVPQDSYLFDTSIRENIQWSNQSSNEEDIWRACEIANADKFVKELPNKLDTIIGDRGIRVSGGQRQRLALARAIIRKPKILILDEATSSLDTESERLIQDSINNLAKYTTVIIIAHRFSTVSAADYVYVLDSGAIIEEGSYNSLISNKDSNFVKMVNQQHFLI